jgi:hypothetical protein
MAVSRTTEFSAIRSDFRGLLFASLILGSAMACSDSVTPTPDAERFPNIVFILADDMGMGDGGAYNPASKVPTPSLDTLAASGMRFTDAHSPSGVCTPTRYGLLTGRYSWRTHMKRGVLKGYSPLLIDPARSTIASMLREQGYATAAIGKWHLGLGDAEVTDYSKPLSPGPNDVGFDYFFGIPASLDMPPYTFVEDDRVFTSFDGDEIGDSQRRREGGEGFWRGGAIARGSAPLRAASPTKTYCRKLPRDRWRISRNTRKPATIIRSFSTCHWQHRIRRGCPCPSSLVAVAPAITETS